MKKSILTSLLLFVTLVLSAENENRGYIVNVGEKCPDFTLTLTDGSSLKLSDLKGKVVMLQFTASWCGVCRKEMPHIEKDIWQKYKNNPNFALYGVDREETCKKVEQFSKEMDITYPLTLDPDSDIFTLFAERKAGVTRNVIVDKDGSISFLTRLYNPEEFDAMKKHIDKLLQ